MMYRCCVFILLLCALHRAYAGPACEATWEEDFAGPLDQTVWNVVEGDGCVESICGWGNNESQSCDEAGIAIEDGILKLKACVDGQGQIRSGKLTTADKQSFSMAISKRRSGRRRGEGYSPHSA